MSIVEQYMVRLRGTYGRFYMGERGGKPSWMEDHADHEVLRFATSDEARAKFRELNKAVKGFFPEERIDIVTNG